MVIKIGLIGAGVVANIHMEAIAKNPVLQLVAISEIDTSKGADFSTKNNCKPYTQYEEMLSKENLDVAVVCLPHHLHFIAGMAVLNAGCNLFMEKPLANTLKECDELIRVASEKNLQLMVGHTHRYMPSIRKAAELIRQGEIGTLNLIIDSVMSYYNWESRMPWHLDPEQGRGGALMNTGPHQIDHLLYLSQSHPVYVHASVQNNRPGVLMDSDVVAHVEFENGVVAILLLFQGYKPKIAGATLRLIGSHGMIEVNPWGNLQLSQGNETREVIVEGLAAMDAEWNEMVAAIHENRPPETDGRMGREVVALINAIYESGKKSSKK